MFEKDAKPWQRWQGSRAELWKTPTAFGEVAASL
jgi:hypothetical protein